MFSKLVELICHRHLKLGLLLGCSLFATGCLQGSMFSSDYLPFTTGSVNERQIDKMVDKDPFPSAVQAGYVAPK